VGEIETKKIFILVQKRQRSVTIQNIINKARLPENPEVNNAGWPHKHKVLKTN